MRRDIVWIFHLKPILLIAVGLPVGSFIHGFSIYFFPSCWYIAGSGEITNLTGLCVARCGYNLNASVPILDWFFQGSNPSVVTDRKSRHNQNAHPRPGWEVEMPMGFGGLGLLWTFYWCLVSHD